jgi:uncharacterized repeat protein (TIGR03803 family)
MKSQTSLKPISSYRRALAVRLATFTLALSLTFLLTSAAQAQFAVVHNFTGGGDGGTPYSGLTLDGAGNLYGTTSIGGSGANGTVFKLTPHGSSFILTTLHAFDGPDGSTPTSGVVRDSNGLLYGATYSGGAHNSGAVFKLIPPARAGGGASGAWTESVLYSFTGGNDGALPDMLGGGLSFDSAGNLYGTTLLGGTASCQSNYNVCGTVFELADNGGHWTETTLHEFAGGNDGAGAYGGVVLDSEGNVYGATFEGGGDFCPEGCGTVYQLVRSNGWVENILPVPFCNPFSCLGGSGPTGIAIDHSGNLYTADGNSVLEMLYPYSGGDGEVLSFGTVYYPTGNLIQDSSGNLYGTDSEGGAFGYGQVFKLTPSGTFTTLHSFTGGADGGQPFGNLVFGSDGNLYGSASTGGSGNSCQGGCGVLFKVAP